MTHAFELPATRPVSPLSVLLVAVIFCGCAVFVRHPAGLAIMAGVWLAGSLLVRVSLLVVLRDVARLWPFLLFVFAVHSLVTGRLSALYGQTYNGLIEVRALLPAALFTARLTLILAALSATLQASPPVRFARSAGRAVGRLPGPGRWLSRSGLLAELSLRFVSFVQAEIVRLRLALGARGQDFGGQGLRGRIAAFRVILYPLLISAFRRADHVSLALTARGFRESVRPTALLQNPVRPGEIAVSAVFALLCLSAPWM